MLYIVETEKKRVNNKLWKSLICGKNIKRFDFFKNI